MADSASTPSQAGGSPGPIVPIVIGTAGHIDHGKSTLVRALTGVDPDRLKEERERGMTIDLGFAPLTMPDGRLVGIVDVPGHERFIRNMVAGASGIDLVILVVAADDGVMPQTKEHLQIMQILGVRRGLVALTKTDLVDADLVDLAEEDVRESLASTFLAGADLLRVSAVTGEGLDAFREALFALAAGTEPRSAEGVFRMPIQRVFSKQGFGTVLTGIPVSGQAAIGDVLEVLPGGFKGKVRGLNAYKHKAQAVRCGHSSAINLSDIDPHRVTRGHVVASPGFFQPQRMVAGRLQVLADLDRSVVNRMPIRLHTGTADPHGEVVVLDRPELAPGESGLVQLRLEEPVICAPGDRFVLRLLSPVITLGGGAIIEESRHRLKRFKDFVIHGLERQEESLSSPAALLESLLAGRSPELVSTDELAVAIKRSRDETREHLAASSSILAPRPERWIHRDVLERAVERVRAAVEGWFADHPHRSMVDVLELRRSTGFEPTLLGVLLEAEAERGGLELLSGGKVRPAGRAAALPEALASLARRVGERLDTARFQPPDPGELAQALGAKKGELARALEHLADAGRIQHVGGELFLSRAAIDEARAAIVENCERNGKLEIPELRDRLGTSRKFLIPLLEHFDAQGLTLRQGAHRVLRRR